MESLLADPLAVRGLMAAIIIGAVAPVLGCYVVLRGMAFFGDALAHIVLPGVVIAFLLGWPLLVGALIAGVLAALLINLISGTTSLKEDSAIGVIFVAAFALGIALISLRGGDYGEELEHILFGNLLAVSPIDLVVIAVLATAVLIFIVAFFKELQVLAFDQVLATTMQLAFLLTRRLPSMMIVAAVFGVFSGVAGLVLSFQLGVASGPMIVLVATVIFGVVFLFAPGRGFIASRRRGSAT
jgi:ABC-type Mn2+/Zn2+ transport system permease subunit